MKTSIETMLKTKKPCSNFFTEFKFGLRETSKYVLSHHLPKDYDRCFVVGKTHLCSRCSGIFAGILFGALLYHFSILNQYYFYFIAFFPVFMLIDWFLTKKQKFKSTNMIRAGTGFLCGQAYYLGVVLFINNFPNIPILVIGVVYAILGLIALVYFDKFHP